MDAVDAGRRLAERHAEHPHPDEPDPVHSLLNLAEAPYEGDWTLRSALCRLAQPEPVRVGLVLELLRRLESPLHHLRRTLERRPVTCDRAVSIEGLARPPVEPYADARTADMARLVAAGLDADDLMAGYDGQDPLDREERLAVPLLAVSTRFEALAATLAAWALVGPEDPPVDAVDRICAAVVERLDQLGVPEETGPPPRGARSSRG